MCLRRRLFLIVLFVFGAVSVLNSYVEPEFRFADYLITRQKRSNGDESSVLVVKGLEGFNRDVVCSSLPVVVKVISQGSAALPGSVLLFQEVADLFVGRVKFVEVSAKSIKSVLGAIMRMGGLREVRLPLFLFFRSGVLIPPTSGSGSVSKRELIKVINNLFFRRRYNLAPRSFGSVLRDMRSYESWVKSRRIG